MTDEFPAARVDTCASLAHSARLNYLVLYITGPLNYVSKRMLDVFAHTLDVERMIGDAAETNEGGGSCSFRS